MQNQPKVTVRCGVTSGRIVGPFILRDTTSAEMYFTMLRDEVWPVTNAWNNIKDLIFMQDGAPPHFAFIVREWPNDQFPRRWMGRRGSHEWPARIPDLTLRGLFLRGWLKE
ncbi:unnamed protein product [Calicophoron daubneyi]|uniref:Transposase n=1 Tax=Calicophoron daubneyi TaxID=300641 RepID=A0AAV2TAV0_CALDB